MPQLGAMLYTEDAMKGMKLIWCYGAGVVARVIAGWFGCDKEE